LVTVRKSYRGHSLARRALPPKKGDKNQLDLFATVRERIADLGGIATVSRYVTGTPGFLCVASAINSSETNWLRPTLLIMSVPFVFILLVSVGAECVRYFQWSDRKNALAIIHGLSMLGTVACVVFLIGFVIIGDHTRAIERANEARAKAAADAEAKAAIAAEQVCQTQRKEEIDRAARRRSEAYRLLKVCRDEFERTKSFFSQETVEERCRPRQNFAEAADREHKAANAKGCPPTPKK
jgi:hypothetical protein